MAWSGDGGVRGRRVRAAWLVWVAFVAALGSANGVLAASDEPVEQAEPESAAVAARFVDPAITYRTPAFTAGHDGFTSNAELREFERTLEANASSRNGVGSAAGTANVRIIELGSSQAGVPIDALLFAHGVAGAGIAPDEVVEGQRPTVLVIAGQHGDEPASTEAAMVMAESLASGPLERLLDRINVVLLLRANPDGAALFQRATASGIDSNRDALWLDTPEAQAIAQLVRTFDPVVVVDLHEYDALGNVADAGSPVPRFDALVQTATTENLAPFVTKAAEEWFRAPMVASLAAESLSTEWYFTMATPAWQATMGRVTPDVLRNVAGLHNAVGLLVETRGVGLGKHHLARRVFTQVTALTSILTHAASRADALVKLRRFVDLDVSALACRGEMTITAGMTTTERTWLMLDRSTGVDLPITARWDSALTLQPSKMRTRPCGYWLSGDENDAAARLRALGVRVEQIDEGGEVRGESYREVGADAAPDEANAASLANPQGERRLQVQTVPSLLDMPKGGYFVPLDQPLANLAVAALEPDSTFSYAAHRIVIRLDHEARLLARPKLRTRPLP